MSTVVPSATLVGGTSMPRFGLGTWSMSAEEARPAVAQSIDAGYRLIDTAKMYDNEAAVGQGLRDSALPREELFVTTKLTAEEHGEREVQEAFAGSAERLGLDYIDLYLIHWPLPSQGRYVDAWRGLIRLREQGLVRAIGVSNFKPEHLDRLIAETGVTPDVNQIQLNPHVTREGVRRYHEAHGIVTQSWSPLGRGVHELLAADLPADGRTTGVLDEPVIVGIARELNRTVAQVVLRWHIDLGLSVVTKSLRPERMSANIDIFDFELTPGQRSAISSLDHGEAGAVDSDDPAVGWG